jgi:dolichyl-phosphate-mannose--protein O-mannosyl transferase
MRGRRWSTRDWFAFAAVLLVAVSTRGIALGEPARPYFDESFYAVDACGYVLARVDCGPRQPASELTTLHPPLGKWLIGAGIEAFGDRPFGWRIASAVAGVLTVALLFLLSRRIAGSLAVAVCASGLLAIDFLHIVHSRIAMLDVFLTMFLVAAAVCWDLDRTRPSSVSPMAQALRPWRVAAGACLGLAMATLRTDGSATAAMPSVPTSRRDSFRTQTTIRPTA